MSDKQTMSLIVGDPDQPIRERLLEKISLLPECRLAEIEQLTDVIVLRCGGLGWLREQAKEVQP